jgi:hypothetical protein
MTLFPSTWRCWPESALESSLTIHRSKTFCCFPTEQYQLAMTSENSPLPAALRLFTAYVDIRYGHWAPEDSRAEFG